MSEMIKVALSVAHDLGLPVFPCRETLTNKGKIAKSPYTRNGYKDATIDEAQICQWWGQYPNALIGVPTGRETGIFVVDIDVGQDKDGEASFNEFGICDPHTCQTIKMSVGVPYIRLSSRHELKNTAGALGKDIDTRGDGGYIIWAGSATSEVPILSWGI